MPKLYKLGRLNPPNKLIQKAKKLFPNDGYWDVTTEDLFFKNNEIRKVEFVCASYADWHSDYKAWTHILVLQCDNHRIGVMDRYGESFYLVKKGDIIKFNIDCRHCLEYTGHKEKNIPFIGLAYDAFCQDIIGLDHGDSRPRGHNLNRFTAVPFFCALIHNMEIN